MSSIAIVYTIRPGDSFSKIAAGLNNCSGVTIEQIVKANDISDHNIILVGQELKIPENGNSNIALVYTVLAGDTLSEIVQGINESAGMTSAAIQSANAQLDPRLLQIGQRMNIPKLKMHSSADVTSNDTSNSQSSKGGTMGYWSWTWEHSKPLNDATLGIAFSGWSDISTALQQSNKIKDSLAGQKYISLGGGNKNGAFTADVLQSINSAIDHGTFKDWDGIAFDIEEGSSGLADLFSETFAKAKKEGFKVIVTISHSAPYGISDGAQLMQAFFQDKNIDILSPQLYTTGKETQNNYATTEGVQWREFASAQAMILPSLVQGSYYQDAQEYFVKEGVTLNGFIQWKQS